LSELNGISELASRVSNVIGELNKTIHPAEIICYRIDQDHQLVLQMVINSSEDRAESRAVTYSSGFNSYYGFIFALGEMSGALEILEMKSFAIKL
jgi:hypothetical protein